MLQTLLTGLAVVGFAMLTVNVHERGHWLVGRLLGIPADRIRVDLNARPPHTAFRAEDG